MPSNHLILCRPLLLRPSVFPSIRVFSNESTLHIRWAEYWNFSFNISPSNEHPGLISFRMDWLDLPAVGLLNISFLFFSSLLIFAISNFYWRSNFIMNIILKIKQEERIYTELAQPKIFFVVVYYFTLILYLASWPHSKAKNENKVEHGKKDRGGQKVGTWTWIFQSKPHNTV